uniref:condensin complex subunit 2-like n=1 Tax=Styela clava TaxID=7725 RepID=UPI00193A26D7|nr:condensin complex subunit 2-like [Styela clava]
MSTPLTSRRRSVNLLNRYAGKSEVSSPQTRRSLNGQGDAPLESPQLPNVHNEEDARERREKRRSRTLAQATGSPLVKPVEEDQGVTAKLTNDQLASHYVNCIKLSTENKITAKNAFNLHLIDHMNEMLKQRCEGTLNFQMAGGTIFASAKIYASRVDAVHSETYKVMSSLGRGASNEKDGSDEESQEDSETRHRGKTKKKRSKILESNTSSLRMKKMDASHQVDPLDQYYSSVFDLASTSGLLVNHLGFCRDGITMRFDSEMDSPITNNPSGGKKLPVLSETSEEDEQKHVDGEKSDRSQEINAMFFELVKLASDVPTANSGVCPTLNNFHWKELEDDSFEWHEEKMADVNEHDSDVIINTDSQPEFDDIEDDIVATCFSSTHESPTETKSEPPDNLGSLPAGMDAGLLASFMPGEYSYFKAGAFSTWEGPNHWKLRVRKPPSSDTASEQSSEKDKIAKGKKRKRNFYVDYKTAKYNVDEKEFELTRKTKEASKRLREKWSKAEDDRLLPSAGEYNVLDLAKCVLQPGIEIRPVLLMRNSKNETPVPQVDSDKLGMYNYDNPNDKNNYCPVMTDDEEGIQGDDGGQADISPGFENDGNRSDRDGGFPDMTLSQTQVFGSQFDVESMLQGSHLISHPKKVEKISIAYAKKATRIDVRRLKAAMWTVLHKDSENERNSNSVSTPTHSNILNGNDSENGDDSESIEDKKMFTDMYSFLPKLMPANMTENLSIPLAFTCLLHLANEKSLKIVAKTDMSDLNIAEPEADFT